MKTFHFHLQIFILSYAGNAILKTLISATNQNEELGYILPQHFATFSQGGGSAPALESIKRIDQLTLFLHEGIINPFTIIDRSASLNRVTIEYRDEPENTGNCEPSFRQSLK